ncbi:MAG: response regulator transcription factor, partial [Dehalococcoidia bacterium]
MRNVVMIEDDRESIDIAAFFLKQRGYGFHFATTGKEGLRLLEDTEADVVVLDLSLPDMDGTEVCRRIRALSNVPVLMLTGRHAETDRLTGFDAGADDYVVKPFSPRELAARVDAILRRARPDAIDAASEIVAGDLVIDLGKHEARINGQTMELTVFELRILALLAKAPERVISREQFLRDLVGNSYERDYRTVDAHVSHLRQKLKATGAASPSIKGIYGRGYKLVV